MVEFVVSRLKFIDESGDNLALTRLFGRARPGVRISEGAPQNRGENVTMLAAIGLGGVSAPMTINRAVDGEVFLAYVREVLSPTLREGDIVVMDNLSAHQVASVREAIEAARRAARVPAAVLARLQPDREALVEAQDLLAAGQGAHARGAGSGPEAGAADHYGSGGACVVRSLRLPGTLIGNAI